MAFTAQLRHVIRRSLFPPFPSSPLSVSRPQILSPSLTRSFFSRNSPPKPDEREVITPYRSSETLDSDPGRHVGSDNLSSDGGEVVRFRSSEMLQADLGSDVGPDNLNSGEGEVIPTPYRSSEIGSDNLSVGSEMDQLEVSSSWNFSVEAVTGFLDRYHDFTGLPWWIVIATSTVAMRVSLLPVLVLQLKKAARIAQLKPLLPPPFPPFQSKRSIIKQYLFFRKKRKELGCPSFSWNFAYFAVQFPTFLTWMSSIRTMSLNHHPGFETGGALWFQNLTIPPRGFIGCIFPILISSLHYTNIQISFQSIQAENMRGILGLLVKYYKLYLDILSLPLFLIGFLIPQGSLVYWSTNSLFTLCQQLALKNEHVRTKLGLPDIKPHINGNGNLEIDKETIESLPFQKILDISLEEMSRGKYESAIPFLRVAIEKNPDSANSLVALGQIMYSKGSIQEAIEYAERAIPKIQEDDPHLILALYLASVAHIKMGKREAAIEYLSRVPDLKVPEKKLIEKTSYYNALVMLGSSLYEVGKKTEALVHLRRAATYDPNINAYVIACENAMEQDKESNGREAADQDKTNNVDVKDEEKMEQR